MRKAIAVLALAAVAALVPATAGATQPDGSKTALCHRTASDTNPYVLIEVDDNAVDTHLNNGKGHPAKENADGSPRNDYVASGAEIEQGFCGEAAPGRVRYRVIRRMTLLKTYFDGAAGLGVAVTCDGTDYTVTFGGEDTVTVPVGDSRQGSIIRVRSEGIVLVKVRESEVC